MDEIKVEQILCGYDNGHRVLSTSLKKPLIQQKDVEILSDASGNGKFNNYISCFPLVEDGYYVFSKTWYAEEMKRPGCVWTHMLLIRFEDIDCNMGYINLQSLFCRPNIGNDYNEYKSTLLLKREQILFDSSYYCYVIYTLFYSDKKALIEIDSSDEYESTILDVLTKLPKQILMCLSICTCACANRYINNEVFSYQATYRGNAKQLSRDIERVIFYKSKNEIEEYPLWVKYISEKFIGNKQEELYKFCNIYQNYDRAFIREFSKLLYAVKEFHTKINLDTFLRFSEKLDIETEVKTKTLESLYINADGKMDEWFSEDSIINQLVLEMQKKEGVFVNKKFKDNSIKRQAKRIYKEKNKERIYCVFEKFIHKELNENAEIIVKELISILKPSDLFDLFDMNQNICSVLVSTDSRFLLCKNIWEEDLNYQLEMLNCVRGKNVPYSKEILSCIIDNTKENISNEVYEIFGNELINYLFYYCENGFMQEQKQINIWVPYLTIDKTKYIHYMPQISNVDILFALMKSVDSYAISSNSELEAWSCVCEKNLPQIKKREYFSSVFLLPIVLKYDKTPDEITNFVYEVIYHKLEKSELDYEYWKKIDPLLPKVAIEQSWDKCLRLRMAFNRHI
jgi:hypothetical protein